MHHSDIITKLVQAVTMNGILSFEIWYQVVACMLPAVDIKTRNELWDGFGRPQINPSVSEYQRVWMM